MSYLTMRRAMTRRELIENPTGWVPLLQQPGLGCLGCRGRVPLGDSILPSWQELTNAYGSMPWYAWLASPAITAAGTFAAARAIQPGSTSADVAKNAVTGQPTQQQVQNIIASSCPPNDSQCAQLVQNQIRASGGTAEDVLAKVVPSVATYGTAAVVVLLLLALGAGYVYLKR